MSGTVSISEAITTNKINIWGCNDKTEKIEFSPSKSVLKKMNAACEYREVQAKELFQHGINNIPQSFCVMGKQGIELCHGSKADILKRFTSSISAAPVYDLEAKSAIVVKMSPLIKAKAYSIDTSSLKNFEESTLLTYYELMRHATNYKWIDVVFDRYFEMSLKEGTRLGREDGSKYSFEGDSTELPFERAKNFLSNSENKDELNEYLAKKLIELHQTDKMMVAMYQDTSLVSHSPLF